MIPHGHPVSSHNSEYPSYTFPFNKRDIYMRGCVSNVKHVTEGWCISFITPAYVLSCIIQSIIHCLYFIKILFYLSTVSTSMTVKFGNKLKNFTRSAKISNSGQVGCLLRRMITICHKPKSNWYIWFISLWSDVLNQCVNSSLNLLQILSHRSSGVKDKNYIDHTCLRFWWIGSVC